MNESELREQLPILNDVLYANSAAGTPAPEPVIDAMTQCLHRHSSNSLVDGGLYQNVTRTMDEARDRLAAFLSVSSDELAITNSTADSVSRLATSLTWESGDVVVQTDIEHPATALPFHRLHDLRGIEIKQLESENGHINLDALFKVASDAELVMIDSITWTHGTRFCISDIADVVHDAGALLLVDAVQSLGQTVVDLSEWNADFVVGSSHKWLLGPWGAGFLYICEDVWDFVRPTGISHWSVVDKWESPYQLKPGARKLEIGGTSPAPYAGLVKAIDVVEDIGVSRIESRIAELTQRFKQDIPSDSLLSPREFESGIVTVAPQDGSSLVDALAAQNIIVRDIPVTKDAIRVSLHAFNTMGEVDILAQSLQ